MKEATSLPKLIERFLSTVCPEELYEEIEGDLILDIPTKGRHDSALKVSVYSGAKVASWTC